MKNKSKFLLIILSFVLLFFINTKDVKAYVDDEVDALGTDAVYIDTRLQSFENAHRCNILFRLYNQYGDIDVQTENWYEKVKGNLEYNKSIVFAVNFATRETIIVGYEGYDWVQFYDNSNIVLDTAPFLTREDYRGCIDTFIEELPEEIAVYKAIRIGIIFIISLIFWNVLIFAISRTYGNKDTTTENTYLSENSRILGRRDIFIRKTVTKVRKSSSSSGGGSSHGHAGHGHF